MRIFGHSDYLFSNLGVSLQTNNAANIQSCGCMKAKPHSLFIFKLNLSRADNSEHAPHKVYEDCSN